MTEQGRSANTNARGRQKRQKQTTDLLRVEGIKTNLKSAKVLTTEWLPLHLCT